MFSRLKSWFRRKTNRLIFKYRAGNESRAADPLAVLRILESTGGADWPTLVQQTERLCKMPDDMEARLLKTDGKDDPAKWLERSKKRSAATAALVEMSRKAFELEPMNCRGEGVTDLEAIGILSEFLVFTGGLAEEARPFR